MSVSLNLGPYSKSVNATAIALVGTFAVVFADRHLDTGDWLSLLFNTLSAAVLITAVKNTQRFRVAKLVVTVLVTLLGSLLASYQAGLALDVSVVLTAILTVLNGFTTYQVTEAGTSATIEGNEVPLSELS